MMGSLVPFQDLNLYPEAAASIATNSAPIALLTPKKEPKLEPFDEPFDAHFHGNTFFQNPNPNFGITSHYQTRTQTAQSQQNIPDPNDWGSNCSGGNVLAEGRQDVLSDETNVLSEFRRISELFNTAFGHKCEETDGAIPDSRAIVPVPEENQMSNVVVSMPRKYFQRSSELVRVTNLRIEDERYFREVVRRTRMTYDSLRLLSIHEEDKAKSLSQGNQVQQGSLVLGCQLQGKRARGDLKAASLMRDRGLWLNRDKRIVGSIPGVYVGDLFFFRMELCVVGLHGLTQAGIDYVPASQSSNGEPIATSIIVSGGYEDDEDTGDVLIYTGHGGQDKNSRQCMHQKLESGNLALERSMHYGIEVRVMRGFKYEGSPSNKVYVYDGLYKIVDTWFDVGKSGFGVYKFKLVRMDNQAALGSSLLRFAQSLRARSLIATPEGYVSLDISKKKENVPVFLFNDIDSDHDPKYYDYLVKTIFPPHVYQLGGNITGCDCIGGCMDECFCAIKNGGEFAYDHNGLLLRGKPLIFECGPNCRCPPTCRNRVSQKGVRNRLEVFRSRETGWGVRSLDLIQAGSFICEYAGVVLTREQAQIFTMNGDSLIYPNRFAERWAEWGDLSQIFSDYTRPAYPSIPPLDFAMDVSTMRNVACYMSQSSSPNVLVQFVLYDHNNVAFPHLMLFSMENIPPLRELSLDYGVADEWMGKAVCN